MGAAPFTEFSVDDSSFGTVVAVNIKSKTNTELNHYAFVACLSTEEKIDEFLQLPNEEPDSGRLRYHYSSVHQDDVTFTTLLNQLSIFAGRADKGQAPLDSESKDSIKISTEVDRLLWEASSVLSDSRPSGDFCVHSRSGNTSESNGNEPVPPIFDGSVANSTPPPLGGASAGASGGAGTILHLACALDFPLILAFLLVMGADGRAIHTGFRRLMIHEAACNGSINCLVLLLEMGKKFSQESQQYGDLSSSSPQFFPDALPLPSARFLTGRSTYLSPSMATLATNMHQFQRVPTKIGTLQRDYLATLDQFRALTTRVQDGLMTELEAARSFLKSAALPETTWASLIRSCAFKEESLSPRAFLRPLACADGHGNTPLHWAAFKNETQCVSLLLQFDANPNARAHPSGWTPLHDAAYSNSSSSIDLLISNGAKVDARANSGATPLCFAAQEDALEAARLLLERGADLTARCAGSPHDDGSGLSSLQSHSRFSGYTPLHYCAHYNAHNASQVLLLHSTSKAAMETPDLSGRLPIHVAVARGSSDVLRELLHAGARIDLRPSDTVENRSASSTIGPDAFFALQETQRRRRTPSPEAPVSPIGNRVRSSSASASPVTSPVLRSLIPDQPINSSKPWNCLTQQAIDECKDLIYKAEQSWSPDRHLLFTPQDRKAVMELLRIGKRLEHQGVLFVDLWPQVLGFCGRGWFEPADTRASDLAESGDGNAACENIFGPQADEGQESYLDLPSFTS